MPGQPLSMSVDHFTEVIRLIRPDTNKMVNEFEMLRELVRSCGLKPEESMLRVDFSHPHGAGGGNLRIDSWLEEKQKSPTAFDYTVDDISVSVHFDYITLSLSISPHLGKSHVTAILYCRDGNDVLIQRRSDEESWTVSATWHGPTETREKLLMRFPEIEFATMDNKVRAAHHRAHSMLETCAEIALALKAA